MYHYDKEMKGDQKGSVWRFRSLPARFIAVIYLMIALTLAGIAFFGHNSGGGAWFAMYFVYWPVSVVAVFLRGMLKNILPDQILHGFPTTQFSVLGIFDALACIIFGTIWYYLIAKCIHCLCRIWASKRSVVKH